MADKKAPASGWPIVSGEYVVGNPESCVAVVTLGSHGLDEAAIEAGAAISGPCHTENLGIEKVVANYISNPNIRFMVVTGSEVQGHITGQCFKALHENGIGSDGGIIGAKGAIPFLENAGEDAITRFQNQIVEIVDLIDCEDTGKIANAVKECISKDPGAFEEDPMVLDLEGGSGEGGEGATDAGIHIEGIPSSAAPDLEYFKKKMDSNEYKVSLITREVGLSSGTQSKSIEGAIYGSLLAAGLIAIPVILKLVL